MPNQQENKIKETAVAELLGMNFFIPGYQRGYRWAEQQVNDLLNDINEFEPENDSWYCLQPLVVKRLKEDTFKRIKKEATSLEEVKSLLKGRWEVIDGQQRLTTIYLILSYLEKDTKKAESAEQKKTYSIEYETREDSKEFLEKISGKNEDEAQSNIDFFYMHKAYKTVEKFFEKDESNEEHTKCYKDKLLNNVKFIWYEIDEGENPVTVFTRLNMGKIPLTNAELIKALFLNRSNFGAGEGKNETLRLRQQEMASEWDTVEYTLQNDEFWLFLNQPGDNRPTRIDFIFDLICEQDALDPEDEKDLKKDVGTDEYRIFRYFYNYFKTENADIVFCWKTVKKCFQIFQEWYNDLELYHYVGYLIEQGETVDSLIKIWENRDDKTKDSVINETVLTDKENKQYDKPPITKNEFKSAVMEKIKDKLKDCFDLDKQYEIEKNSKKTQCRPLLLLHNIQTVINQNKQMENSKYGLATFYKFPFHLFKLEKWDVEHIDSNTENDLSDKIEQKEWLKCVLVMFPKETEDKKDSNDENKDLKEKIKTFIKEIENSENNKETDSTDNKKTGFECLRDEIFSQHSAEDRLSDVEKNMVWNFTLLDSHTNRSYGNSIFPVKRRVIIGKDQGIRYEVDENLEVKETTGKIAFIPLVTKNVFLKYYNPNVNNLKEWTKEDAEAYKKNILDTLKEFGVTDSSSDKSKNNK